MEVAVCVCVCVCVCMCGWVGGWEGGRPGSGRQCPTGRSGAFVRLAQRKHSHYRTQQHLGKIEEVLIEKASKKSDAHWSGRNSQNTVVVFPKENHKPGDFVNVKITDCTAATLIGEAVGYSDNN